MVRRMWLGAVVLAALVVPGIAIAASSSRQVWVTNDCTREQRAPKAIVLTCGDGLTRLGSIQWVTWTAMGAAGVGKFDTVDCTPDCAAGKAVSYRVAVTLSKPKRCRGQAHKTFSHAELSFPGKHPTPEIKNWTIDCPV
jgi:hypothetical protein